MKLKRFIEKFVCNYSLKELLLICMAISFMFTLGTVGIIQFGMRKYTENVSYQSLQIAKNQFQQAVNTTKDKIFSSMTVLTNRENMLKYVSESPAVKVVKNSEIRSVLDDAVEYIPEISKVFVFTEEGELTSSRSGENINAAQYRQIIDLMAVCKETNLSKTTVLIPNSYGEVSQYALVFATQIFDWENPMNSRKAWCLFCCTEKDIDTLFSFSNLPFAILKDDNMVFQSKWSEKTDDSKEIELSFDTLKIKVSYSVENDSKKDFLSLDVLILILSGVFILGEIVLMVCMYISVVAPIKNVINQMNTVNLSNTKIYADVSQKSEMSSLVYGVNHMLTKIEDLHQHQIDQELKLAHVENARLQEANLFLQVQINPHFLYNTLECVNGMLLRGKKEIASSVLCRFADLYRYCAKVEQVTLECEIDAVKEYVKMMEILHEATYNLYISIDEDLSEIYIPRMVIQPAVENAIRHGFDESGIDGNITINGVLYDGMLEISVVNDGASIDEKMLEELNARLENKDSPANSLGIINVSKRLKILYGDKSGVQLENIENGVMTRIRINLLS